MPTTKGPKAKRVPEAWRRRQEPVGPGVAPVWPESSRSDRGRDASLGWSLEDLVALVVLVAPKGTRLEPGQELHF